MPCGAWLSVASGTPAARRAPERQERHGREQQHARDDAVERLRRVDRPARGVAEQHPRGLRGTGELRRRGRPRARDSPRRRGGEGPPREAAAGDAPRTPNTTIVAIGHDPSRVGCRPSARRRRTSDREDHHERDVEDRAGGIERRGRAPLADAARDSRVRGEIRDVPPGVDAERGNERRDRRDRADEREAGRAEEPTGLGAAGVGGPRCGPAARRLSRGRARTQELVQPAERHEHDDERERRRGGSPRRSR